MMVFLRNDAGLVKQVKVGFAWTAFFFHGFPYFFRGMPVHGIIYLAGLISAIALVGGLSGNEQGALVLFLAKGISLLVSVTLGALMNKQTAVHCLENGYKPIGGGWDVAAAKWNLPLSSKPSSTEARMDNRHGIENDRHPDNVSPATQVCPFCGESILAVAAKCKHCGEFLDPSAFQTRTASQARTGLRVVVGSITGGVAVVLACGALYLFSGAGAQVNARCTVNGFGNGSCEFENMGWSPGSECVRIVLRNSDRREASSRAVCSGRVWPGEVATRTAHVDLPKNHCRGLDGEQWKDACEMEVFSE